ncbi:oligosaccharide flippase family protein, partial [Megamonas funiformis]|uniref:oligosaccharide flippase family protein n=1 Tax=Megamonas funiformis TaxID=437897 RepID=UPI000FF674B3
MNQKKIGILLSYGNIIITIITNLIYTPIMLKILGQSEYGIYTLSSSLVGYFSLLYAGLSSTYMRYYFRYKKDNDKENICKLNGLFLSLFTILGIFVFVIILAAIYNIEE